MILGGFLTAYLRIMQEGWGCIYFRSVCKNGFAYCAEIEIVVGMDFLSESNGLC